MAVQFLSNLWGRCRSTRPWAAPGAPHQKPIDPCEEFSRRGVYESPNCRTSVVAGTNNRLPSGVVTLVMQYLPPIAPKTRNWETEWSGLVGRDVVWFALNQACGALAQEQLGTDHQVKGKSETRQFTLRRDRSCLDIINDYLEKGNKFGAERIEKAYSVYRMSGRERILVYCPKYNPDYPLPVEIDDLMQTPLEDRFTHPDALVGLPDHVTRMTHLIGLYLKPEGMTAHKAHRLVNTKWGIGFDECSWQKAIVDDDNTPTKTTEWRWFGEFVLGRGTPWAIQLALIPPGLEPPVHSDTYCEFTHFACTGSWNLGEKPLTFTCTSKVFEKSRVVFGGACASGLFCLDNDSGAASVALGVAPCGSS